MLRARPRFEEWPVDSMVYGQRIPQVLDTTGEEQDDEVWVLDEDTPNVGGEKR